jgi:phage terminase large subunit GpA-like protein
MNWVQKFFTSIFPASWAKSMEADSRRWFMKCLKCGFEESYWNLGGIRWKAKGNQRNYRKCPRCGKRSWHKTYKKEVNDQEKSEGSPE